MNRLLLGIFLFIQGVCFANSVNLFNDSDYPLKAVIYDASGTMLGEFMLNSRDAAEWSDDEQNAGTESSDAPQIPYTVNWFCSSGGAFGTCNNVAAGSIVTAQSCGGAQECPGDQEAN